MPNYLWEVIAKYNPENNYSEKITPKMARTLQKFNLEETFTSAEFAEKHQNDKNWLTVKTLQNAKNTVFLAIHIAQKIGVVRKNNPANQKTVFDDFIKIPIIVDWLAEMMPMNLKNTKQTKYDGTKGRYAYTAWKFNDWLIGKEIELSVEVEIAQNTFQRKSILIELKGLAHLLELLQKPRVDIQPFNKICKKYLRDPIHSKKRATTMKNVYNVIKSFFIFYDTQLTFSFNYKAIHKMTDGDDEKKLMTLEDFFKLMTMGRPTITEKAVFMSKLHRGLDNVTLTDRFNYQAFEQLSSHFGTEDHNAWDLDLCPVPIDLVRVKTRFKHRGFLDRDAVTAIQDVLDERKRRTDTTMKIGQPLFLSKFGKPISEGWVYSHFCTLADRAKLRHIREGHENSYNMDAHESRDLLKSVAKKCKVDADARDHFIGHMPKDSYEKESILFPETLKVEYAKMSSKLNIFTRFSNVVNETDDSDTIKAELKEVKEETNKLRELQKEQTVTRYQDDFFARNQQEKMNEQDKKLSDILQIVDDLKSELRVLKKGKSEKMEFCCIKCEMIHDKDKCPACGSKQRRIYEDKVAN